MSAHFNYTENLKKTFITINYNSCNYVKNLIASKYSVISGSKDEIIIIDNNSSEKEIDNISRIYSDVKFYSLKENVGFSRANNYAVEKSDTEYIVFVNPDVLFTEDCINPIIEFIKNTENAGACGPMLLNGDMSIQNSTGFKMGLLYDFAEAFFLIGLIRKLYNLRFFHAVKHKLPCKVAWLSAALLIIKKDVFLEVGGFDSNYILNYEDIDLCRCLRDRGYKNYFFPYLKSIHYSHQSFKRDYELLVYSRYMSRRIYAKKHYNMLSQYLVSLMHIIGLLIRISTVYIFYSGLEKKQRYSGYKRSLKLYIFRNYGIV